jgi:hypothetical protein
MGMRLIEPNRLSLPQRLRSSERADHTEHLALLAGHLERERLREPCRERAVALPHEVERAAHAPAELMAEAFSCSPVTLWIAWADALRTAGSIRRAYWPATPASCPNGRS